MMAGGLGLGQAVLCVALLATTLFSSCSAQAPADAQTNAGGGQGGIGSDASSPAFDGQKAFAHLEAQVAFGPRNPGSDGHAACLTYLRDQLGAVTDSVELQPFTHKSIQMAPGKSFSMTNVIGLIESASGAKARKVVLLAHWDTRPVADRDSDSANRKRPILGANDGASGVAVLLELARVLRASRPSTTVVILLVDGEDFGTSGDSDEWFLGSKYFAEHMGTHRPSRGVLLDMVGDKDLVIEAESLSIEADPALMEQLWSVGGALGYRSHFPESPWPSATVYDDHLPLIDAGVPTVDLIDFDYPPWHTMADTVDKCSADSLKVVGDTVLQAIRDGI